MAEYELNLETEGESAVTFQVMLERIHTRPDSHCKWAYDFFDERIDGDTTAIVGRMADMGWTTKQIYERLKRFFPTEALNWPPRMHEMIVLEIEWAVRRAKT